MLWRENPLIPFNDLEQMEFWLAALGPLICFRDALVYVFSCVLWEARETSTGAGQGFD